MRPSSCATGRVSSGPPSTRSPRSPTLRQVAQHFRANTTNAALARRVGVGLDDRRLKLVAAVWSAIIMTANSDLGPATDWQNLGVDAIVSRVEDTFVQFIDVMRSLRLPV